MDAIENIATETIFTTVLEALFYSDELRSCAGIFEQSIGARNLVGIGLSYGAGIFKTYMGARHRVGIGLLYRPARLHGLAEFIPWYQFRGPINI